MQMSLIEVIKYSMLSRLLLFRRVPVVTNFAFPGEIKQISMQI